MKFNFKNNLFYVLGVLSNLMFCQNSLIGIDEQNKDVGTVDQIYKVKADFIITNHQAKNLFLLRADAEKGITIQTSKKTIKPNDTTLIVVEFIPNQTGQFSKSINLITSADGLPFTINLKGNIKSIKFDDKTACFYFKKPNNASVKTIEPIASNINSKPKDVSNKIPDNTINQTKYPISTQTVSTTKTITPKVITPESKTELEKDLYKPNNIIFLVDVSSSMKDTNKLKVMQYALHYLIDALRETDKITVITYADSVRTLRNGISGADKTDLHTVVDLLKAKGITKGKKAVLYSLDVALKNYIEGGNNQIMLATDGKFRFDPEDQQTYITKQGIKQVKLTTIAFGEDKEAMKNLKEIAKIGNGNFIHIKSKIKAKDQLLTEVKENSLK
jgi:Mg-chelatase subunit ChlD